MEYGYLRTVAQDYRKWGYSCICAVSLAWAFVEIETASHKGNFLVQKAMGGRASYVYEYIL